MWYRYDQCKMLRGRSSTHDRSYASATVSLPLGKPTEMRTHNAWGVTVVDIPNTASSRVKSSMPKTRPASYVSSSWASLRGSPIKHLVEEKSSRMDVNKTTVRRRLHWKDLDLHVPILGLIECEEEVIGHAS